MNRQEAEELLPWFVAGTLDEEEARAVQAFIDNGEISSEELEALRLFRETVSERQAEEPAYNPAILNKAMSQLDGITQEAPEVPVVVGEVGSDGGAGGRVRASEDSPGLIQRILDALQWATTPPMARAVVVGQFALLFGLAVIIATGTEEVAPESEFGTVSGTETATTAITADLSFSFAPGTTEADLRALLLEHQLSIVSGPSALGLYRAAAAEGTDIEALVSALDANPLVLFVQPVLQP
jgi:hypothetical protein